MKKLLFVIFFSKKKIRMIFSQQPSGLGFQSLYTGCEFIRLSSFGQVNRGSMNYIVATSSARKYHGSFWPRPRIHD